MCRVFAILRPVSLWIVRCDFADRQLTKKVYEMNKFIPLSIPNFEGNEKKYVDVIDCCFCCCVDIVVLAG